MRKYRFEFVVNGSEMMETMCGLIEKEVKELVITQLPEPEATVEVKSFPVVDWGSFGCDKPALYRKGDPISENYAKRGCARVLMEFAKGGEFDSYQAAAQAKECGYNPNSASATLTRLARLGLIERTNPGHRPFRYRLTPPKGFIVDGEDDGHN